MNFNISYPDLIKFPYFTNTFEKGDRGKKVEEIGGETKGDFTDHSMIDMVFNLGTCTSKPSWSPYFCPHFAPNQKDNRKSYQIFLNTCW